MKILADSSVWIDFFRRKNKNNQLPELLVEELVVTNPVILSEILPSLKISKQSRTIELLEAVEKVDMEIDWDLVVETQIQYSKKFNHFVGIPDILIVQNALQKNFILYSFDKDIFNLCEMLKCLILK